MPAPKSGCNVTVAPMKLIMLAEFGSTGAVEMSVFHKLEPGNGTNPFRLAPCPTLMPVHVPFCANPALGDSTNTQQSKNPLTMVFISMSLFCLTIDLTKTNFTGPNRRRFRIPDKDSGVMSVVNRAGKEGL